MKMTHYSSDVRRMGQSHRRRAACTACLRSIQLGSAQRPATQRQSQLQRKTHLTGSQLSKRSARCSVYLRLSCYASARPWLGMETQVLPRTRRGRALCPAQHGVLRWTGVDWRSTHAAGGHITEASCQGGCALGLVPHTCRCTAACRKGKLSPLRQATNRDPLEEILTCAT